MNSEMKFHSTFKWKEIQLEINSFINTNLIGANPKLCHKLPPLRLTAAGCAFIRRYKTKTKNCGSARHRALLMIMDYSRIFVTLITLLKLNFSNFFQLFFLKVGMLYHIFEAFHPSPTTKGSFFSKFALRKNHNGKIGCLHILD